MPLLPALDGQQQQPLMLEHFENLSDPLRKQGVLHPFVSIVMIAPDATIGGATGWEDIETYGISHHQWLGSFLALPNGIPCADTYRRVFEKISPRAKEDSFQSWLSSLVTDNGAQVIPIDGKQLKSSYDRNQAQSALHMVSAIASEHRLFRRSCESG
ncbi:ISAs1 family transposase [Moorena sp. SIO1F2]|uniref:ISAs1 family transposase n=1 Tax=Moorena sp. SIO1F2 TaxID=2607819 RepID=UPI00345BBE08